MAYRAWGMIACGLLICAAARCTPMVVLPDVVNLPYASDHARQQLDIYLPDAAFTPAPVVVWIHGGGWEVGDKIGAIFTAPDLLPRGFAVVAINYRLSQHAIFPAQLHDAKAAIRWVRAHASAYGFDADRIAVWGTSAGGHVAALLGTTGDMPEAEGVVGDHLDQSSRVQAVVDYSGPTDLLNITLDVTEPPGTSILYDSYSSMISRLIGFDQPGEGIGILRARQSDSASPFAEKMALVTLANPIRHVTPYDPPFFIAHGTLDTVVPLTQSTRLMDALEHADILYNYQVIDGAGHVLPPEVDDAAIDFLEGELIRSPY